MSLSIKSALTNLAVAAMVFLTSCAALQPVRRPVEPRDISLLSASVTGKEQNSLLTGFKVLNTGRVKVPLKGMLNTKKLSEGHGLPDELWVEVFAYLFHHPKHGWYMIDTGLDSTFRRKGNIRGLLAGSYILESHQEPGQNIGTQMNKEGKELSGIFFTHLHGDHSAGLPELDRNIPKFVGKGDHYHSIPLLYKSNHLSRQDTLIELDAALGSPFEGFRSVLDVFGDGSLMAIHTPGHSEGHLSYLLNTAEGQILLTGDASHTRYGFENGIEPGWVEDEAAATESLKQLMEFIRQNPKTRVIFGHEMN